MNLEDRIKTTIREVPDFPINGVLFKDISPFFLDPELVLESVNELADPWSDHGVTKVLGIESRGFLLGPSISMALNAGFVIARKQGKLPPETHSISYQLEYGNATIEVVKDNIVKGDKVLIHDDLLATGGTASAAAKLVQEMGATVVGFSFLINLSFLKGEEQLAKLSDHTHYLVNY